jgi:hypothetical protein
MHVLVWTTMLMCLFCVLPCSGCSFIWWTWRLWGWPPAPLVPTGEAPVNPPSSTCARQRAHIAAHPVKRVNVMWQLYVCKYAL